MQNCPSSVGWAVPELVLGGWGGDLGVASVVLCASYPPQIHSASEVSILTNNPSGEKQGLVNKAL